MQKRTVEEIAQNVINNRSVETLYENDLEKLSGIYMFISIDLVNSTIFKTRYTKYWPFVIQAFYKIVTMALGAEDSYRDINSVKYIGTKDKFDLDKMKTGGFKVWKLVGDEVLLYHKVVSVSEILNTVRIMYYITDNIRGLFLTYAKKTFGEDTVSYEEFARIAQRHLMAKTTIWCADCGAKTSIRCPNMFYNASDYMETSEICLDFLGPDIDAGFRLCSYAEKNKVIVSPNLMSLLSIQINRNEEVELKTEIARCYRIVAYVELEDVWEKRLYPIFLYCPCDGRDEKEKQKNQPWVQLFEYDELECSALTKYILTDEEFYDSPKYTYSELIKIYKDLGREQEIEDLKNKFTKQVDELKKVRNIVQQTRHRFEFHISCACYYEKEDKIWIYDHPNHGLSFGCIRIEMNHDYREKVAQFYRDQYKIDISFKEELDFISFYSVDRNNSTEEILGIILLVKAIPRSGEKTNQANGWYSFDGIRRKSKNRKKIKEFDDIIQRVERKVRNK